MENAAKGVVRGGIDVVVDTFTGAFDMLRHPIQTGISLINMVIHPVDTGKYIWNAISESYDRDMRNGDAESRARWVTYVLGSAVGTKGAGNIVKGSKVITNAANAPKTPNVQIPSLFPFGPQHQLANVGPVPYNVVDSVNLRDQLMMSAKHFLDNKKTKLKPSITYRTGEFNYLYKTDELGRIREFSTDNLQLTEREKRLPHNPDTPGKQPGDHAGHLAGDRFGGSPELDNLVFQLSSVNLSAYKKVENQWATALRDGKQVTVNVKINYDGKHSRPESFKIEYTIDGKYDDIKLKNNN